MDDRIVKFRVGVMVVATMFLTGIMVLLFGDVQSYFRGYTIYIHFAEAPGVTDGTPIRKSGIRIGRVTKVNFAPQGGVIVEATIDRDVELYARRNSAGHRIAAGRRRGDSVRQAAAAGRTALSRPTR